MTKIFNPKNWLSVFTFIAAVGLVVLGTARFSWADSYADEMRDFNHFLRDHPRVHDQLRRDPYLASDRRYLNDNDALRNFLRAHPQVRRELETNPNRAMNRSYAWDRRTYERNDDRPWWDRGWFGWGR
jgi:hypothetical protein